MVPRRGETNRDTAPGARGVIASLAAEIALSYIDLRTSQNRLDLTGSTLFLEDIGATRGPVACGPRIGIRVGTEHHWRLYVVGHPSVSGR